MKSPESILEENLFYFAEHSLVRTSEEYKISPWKSVSAKNFTIASN